MIKKSLSIILALLLCFGSFGAIGTAASDVTYAVSDFDFAVKSAEMVKNGGDSMLRIIGKLRSEAAAFAFPYAADSVLAENGMFVLSFESEGDLLACLEALESNPDVLFAERDVPVYTEALEETEEPLSWGVEAIEADIYADSITPSRTVTIAIIDSGTADIDYLKDKLVDGYDFYDNDSDATNDISDDSHGTFVASIVADCAGTLPVKIMPVRVLKSETAALVNVINGINYAVNNGADVINLSLCAPLANCKVLEATIASAEAKGVTVVTCAGNDKSDTQTYCPSHCKTVITVSAINMQNGFCTSFSNFGDEVYLAAPGEAIIGYNAAGELAVLNGTSLSTAFVSAAAAMFLVDNPYCNPNQVRSALKESAYDLGEAGKDIYYGWGIPKLSKLAESDITYVEGVSLPADSYTLSTGDTLTIEPVFYPADATDKSYELTSDSDVISINGNVITAVKAGTATLTVTSNDGLYAHTAKITVRDIPPEIKIVNNTGTKIINYGETLRLTAQVENAPADVKIWWYVDNVKSGEGTTFELSPKSGVTVSVKLVDASGNTVTDNDGGEISDSQTVNVKNGFLQRLISFFKNLFGISRIVIQSIKYV